MARAVLGRALAELVGAALYPERPALDKGGGELFSGAVVDELRRRPGDAHIFAALGLGAALIVYEADGLIFLNGHEHGRRGPLGTDGGAELIAARQAADPAALFRTWHIAPHF